MWRSVGVPASTCRQWESPENKDIQIHITILTRCSQEAYFNFSIASDEGGQLTNPTFDTEAGGQCTRDRQLAGRGRSSARGARYPEIGTHSPKHHAPDTPQAVRYLYGTNSCTQTEYKQAQHRNHSANKMNERREKFSEEFGANLNAHNLESNSE